MIDMELAGLNDYEVLAAYSLSESRRIIIARWGVEFVTWNAFRRDDGWHCENGDYCSTVVDAWRRYNERASDAIQRDELMRYKIATCERLPLDD